MLWSSIPFTPLTLNPIQVLRILWVLRLEARKAKCAQGVSNQNIIPLKYIEYGLYADLIVIYPKPCSIYLRGTIGAWDILCCTMACTS